MCQSSSYVPLDPFFSPPLMRRELITAVCVLPASVSAVSWPPADVASEKHWWGGGAGQWKEPVIILTFFTSGDTSGSGGSFSVPPALLTPSSVLDSPR